MSDITLAELRESVSDACQRLAADLVVEFMRECVGETEEDAKELIKEYDRLYYKIRENVSPSDKWMWGIKIGRDAAPQLKMHPDDKHRIIDMIRRTGCFPAVMQGMNAALEENAEVPPMRIIQTAGGFVGPEVVRNIIANLYAEAKHHHDADVITVYVPPGNHTGGDRHHFIPVIWNTPAGVFNSGITTALTTNPVTEYPRLTLNLGRGHVPKAMAEELMRKWYDMNHFKKHDGVIIRIPDGYYDAGDSSVECDVMSEHSADPKTCAIHRDTLTLAGWRRVKVPSQNPRPGGW